MTKTLYIEKPLIKGQLSEGSAGEAENDDVDGYEDYEDHENYQDVVPDDFPPELTIDHEFSIEGRDAESNVLIAPSYSPGSETGFRTGVIQSSDDDTVFLGLRVYTNKDAPVVVGGQLRQASRTVRQR